MPDAASWTIVALAFVVLPIATRPAVSRAIQRSAQRFGEWAQAREARRAAMDPEQEKLWQWSKRRRLCIALDRIERLLATDSRMSATRQLGNRLAYDQLVAELRRTPDVFPAGLEAVATQPWAPSRSSRRRRASEREGWDDRDFAAGWSATPAASGTQSGAVEVIEIGWRRR